MVYTARTVVVGKTGNDPFVGFILASKSLRNRRLEIRRCENSEKIYVFPARGFELDNINYPEVDNYACVISEQVPNPQSRLLVGFNGHMAKRCAHNILDGMNPFLALDSTLFEFRGSRGDARVGAVVYASPAGEVAAYFGINDIDRMEKRVKKINLESNRASYLCVSDTSQENLTDIPQDVSSDQLADFIANGMIPNLEKLIAVGVCVLRKNGQDLSVYNTFK